MGKLKEQIKRIAALSESERFNGHTVQDQLLSLVEEVGELSRAVQIEDGNKNSGVLTESSTIEAVDVVICALTLYFARGGEISDLSEILYRKIDKWESNLAE